MCHCPCVTAVLVLGCPEEAGFMADEAVWGMLGKQSLKYNVKEYLSYMDEVHRCRDALRQQGNSYTATPVQGRSQAAK